MSNLGIFVLSFVLGLVGFGLVALWYVVPWLRKYSFVQCFTPLLLLNCFRYLGLAFLLPGVTGPNFPADFARQVAYGDMLAVILAFVALAGVRFRWPIAIWLALLFNIVGTLDLLNGPIQGLRLGFDPAQFGATYFIPTLYVPALLVTHVVIFWLLWRFRRWPRSETII